MTGRPAVVSSAPPAPAEATALMGTRYGPCWRQKVHGSHRLSLAEPINFCRRCGAYCASYGGLRGLRAQCPGDADPTGPAGWRVRKLAAGWQARAFAAPRAKCAAAWAQVAEALAARGGTEAYVTVLFVFSHLTPLQAQRAGCQWSLCVGNALADVLTRPAGRLARGSGG